MCIEYDKDVYTAKWFSNREKYRPYIESILKPILGRYGSFKSALDLGAGDAWYAHVLSADAVAVEVAAHAKKFMPENVKFVEHDLREPLNLNRLFDVVVCIEVAEHLPESASSTLCNTISRHAGNLVLFSAASPGQPGKAHINCQEFGYWREKLESGGLTYCKRETESIRRKWRKILGSNMQWLPKNIRLFIRE